ncbi:MAG TPA: LPS export ABC transporter permease LptG [Sphingomonadaceae bacterium]|nr:LPS export ABC transporter permease LptG [Sphingomonadaceae bacterium]
MRLEFFPSRTLTLYLARLFVTRILAVLIMLVLVVQTLDLLGNSGEILAYPGNGEADLWRYVALRLPMHASKFLSYSVLLATIITLATLNQNSEVISMKAAGLSAHQILAPLMLAAAGVSVVTLAFNELVVTSSVAELRAWRSADYGPKPDDPGARQNVYLADGPDILAAQTVHGRGSSTELEGVTFYQRDSRGAVSTQIRAPRASYAGPGWRLEEPVRFNVETATSETLEPLVVASGLTPDQIEISGVDPEAQNALELARSIDLLERNGLQTEKLRGFWWHKFSGPLAAILMPLLGAVAGFGLARSGHLFIRAVIGISLGFAYFVVDNTALAMGNFGGYPPILAAWAPFFLFALLGETVLIRTEE